MHAFLYGVLGVLLPVAVMATRAVGDQPGKPVNSDVAKLAESDNRFAVDIFTKVKEPDKNEFLSPYSISTVLAMAYEGARGQTAEEMAKTLHFDLPQDRLGPAFGQLAKQLTPGGKESALVIANALWAQKDYELRPEYVRRVQSEYGGKVTTLDFKGAAEASRKTINQWVEEQTREKIKDLIGPGMLDPMTRLVLTNAIYFKDAWISPFPKSQTNRSDFTGVGGRKIPAEMMNQQHHFDYFEDGDLQILQMGYRGSRLAMVILLPRQVDGLGSLEKNLDAASLTAWLSKLKMEDVKVTMPKFRVERSYSLADPLKSMGMKAPFSLPPADFSGMSERKDLYISFIVHKTFVKVDEEGTEAAAATGMGMAATAMPVPHEPKVFRADHPFLFLIRDVQSGSILFLGHLMDPTQKDAG